MPTPQTQRSAYRDRRVNVMLQENPGETAPPRGSTPEHVRHSPKSSILYISLATAALCAFIMFFLLFRRDSPPAAKTIPSQPVQSPAQTSQSAVPASKTQLTASAPPTAQSAPAATPLVPPANPETTPIQRVHFRLKRSSRSQAFGPISLRLVATNARRGSCSLLIAAANSRPTQRAIQVNRPLEIPIENGSTANILINAVNRDSVSGYVTQAKE